MKSKWNSQFLIRVPSLFMAEACIWVLPNFRVTLTVFCSTLCNERFYL